jgi:hypothetical protein
LWRRHRWRRDRHGRCWRFLRWRHRVEVLAPLEEVKALVLLMEVGARVLLEEAEAPPPLVEEGAPALP